MVAVPRSNGCTTCRAKKVKCDETLPVCKRCQDSGRECAYRDKFTFVDEASKRKKSDTPSDGGDERVSKSPQNSVWLLASESRTESGSLFQKWRRTDAVPDLVATPTLSPGEMRAQKLIACFREGHIGTHMDLLGTWLTWISQRMGVSAALDDAIMLMSSVHNAMMRGRGCSTWIDAKGYLQAVKSLREAIADPGEGYSGETLAAAFILYYLEASLRPSREKKS
ncbi:hypothetical protein NA57DRAFT_75168 [Rhizodiscina lignyota]|uniref:Zn(2)-C6 fungal-type domain-containing protein n=1 Tax=Rhizodiscina lignyota TaxID=1504668 RepID=A0A9P4IDM7_9PEZI|nr:hypothetical protein NA57DRAFT_75168 [Rhizodiscina lignyota]